MKLLAELVSDIAPATFYRYRTALREYFEIAVSQGQQVRHIAAEAMLQAAQVMNNPADIINTGKYQLHLCVLWLKTHLGLASLHGAG